MINYLKSQHSKYLKQPRMSVHSGGEEPPPEPGEKRRRIHTSGGNADSHKYKIFTKPNYKRLFIENNNTEFTVYVQSTEDEKLGNKNPITLTNLITDQVKDVIGVHRINAHKIGITFRKAADNFLKMEDFLWIHKMKAFIPSNLTERVGVLRYVPKDLSNEEIYKSMVCDAEVVSIKRFMRKVEGKLVPLNTISVTFASTTLPQYAYIKLFRYEVKTYIPPLLQCYKCLKFNHSAKVCRGEQHCSSCAGRHSYRDCDVEEVVCINCSGNHLAISRECPIKKQKIEERKAKYLRQQMQQSYATVVNTPPTFTNKSFPSLPKVADKPKVNDALDMNKIANNDIIINAIVKSLVALGNKSDSDGPLTHKRIKEIFLSNLI